LKKAIDKTQLTLTVALLPASLKGGISFKRGLKKHLYKMLNKVKAIVNKIKKKCGKLCDALGIDEEEMDEVGEKGISHATKATKVIQSAESRVGEAVSWRRRSCGWLCKKAKAAKNALKEKGNKIKDAAKRAAKKVKEKAKKGAETIKEKAKKVKEKAKKGLEKFKSFKNQLLNVVKKVKKVKNFLRDLKRNPDKILQFCGAYTKVTAGLTKAPAMQFEAEIILLGQRINLSFTIDTGNIGKTIKNIVETVWKKIKDMIDDEEFDRDAYEAMELSHEEYEKTMMSAMSEEFSSSALLELGEEDSLGSV